MEPGWDTQKVPYIRKSVAPTVSDDDFPVPFVWIDDANNTAYLLTDNTPGAAVWISIGLGGLGFDGGYGVRWDTSASSPVLEKGLIVGGKWFSIEYSNHPIQERMKRCVMPPNTGVVGYYLHADNSVRRETPVTTGTADGTTADHLIDSAEDFLTNGSARVGDHVYNITDDTWAQITNVADGDLTLDADIFVSGEGYEIGANLAGTDGQVCVETPKFHYINYKDGIYQYFLIGLNAFTFQAYDGTVVSSAVHPWFLEGGSESDYKYIGAFEGVLKRGGVYVDGTGSQTGTAGDLIHSVYGYIPLTYFHRTERRTYSVDGVFHQWSIFAEEAIILLYLTEYATWYSQSAIPGYTEGGGWDFAKVCKTGITVQLGNASGSVTWADTSPTSLRCSNDFSGSPTIVLANSFRGVENFFGHVWKWVDGVNIQYVGAPLTDAEVYVCNTPGDWADDTATGYTHVEDQDGTFIDLPLTSNYQSALHPGTLWPSAVGGGSTTYITDYFYASSAAGWRALRSGGSLHYGAYAGVACRNANLAASYRLAHFGGRSAA